MLTKSILTVLAFVLAASMTNAASAQLTPQAGRFFKFVVPAGWTVEENANSLSLQSPDRSAGVQHVGLAGMLNEVSPQQFVQHVLSKGSPDLQFVAGQPIQPAPGCKSAEIFEVTYTINGTPCRGIAICNVAVGYQQCNAAMTIAACRAEQFPAARNTLMQMAMAVAPSGGGDTYTASAIGRQNLNNSVQYGQVATQYRNEANANWQAATDMRGRSMDANNWQFRQTLGNATQYYNPYTSQLENYSSSNAVYWQNPYTGQIVGDANGSFDPRTATDPNWVRMQEQGYQGR